MRKRSLSGLRFQFKSVDEANCSWYQIRGKSCSSESLEDSKVNKTIETSFLSKIIATTPLLKTGISLIKTPETSFNSNVIRIKQKKCSHSELNFTWKCSKALNHRSICVKKCENGGKERKKCICSRDKCSWSRKSLQCDTNSLSGSSAEISEKQYNFLKFFIQNLKLINKGEININFQLR